MILLQKFLATLVVLLCLSVAAWAEVKADERTMDAQLILKERGIYYSEIDGIMGVETQAAIRRYQIRHGLMVTGELDAETSRELGLEGEVETTVPSPPPEARVPKPTSATTSPRGGVGHPGKNHPAVTSIIPDDHQFLREEEARDVRRSVELAPPTVEVSEAVPVIVVPSATLEQLFATSPFSRSPLAVQRDLLMRSQIALARGGYYREPVDGLPGPATQQALYSFQRDNRLTATGLCDTTTLSQLGVLQSTPSRRDRSYTRPVTSRPAQRKVYRGIWVR